MAAVDLLFLQLPLANPAELVFGDTAATVDRLLYVDAELPGPVVEVSFGRAFELTVDVELPAPDIDVSLRYDISVDRPLTSATASQWQEGPGRVTGAQTLHRGALQTLSSGAPAWQKATPAGDGASARHQDSTRMSAFAAARHQITQPVPPTPLRARHQEGVRNVRPSALARHQVAVPVADDAWSSWQERYRDRRPSVRQRYQEAVRAALALQTSAQSAIPYWVEWVAPHQEAMRPPAGRYDPPPPPPPQPCYTPLADLLFQQFGPATTSLVFICENHPPLPPLPPATLVVPIRSVYVTINTVSLQRLPGGPFIPVLSMDLSIDVDSWTWTWSATVPGDQLASVEPAVLGEPVEFQATINGIAYHLIAESLTRDRSHARSRLRIAGRGRNAILSEPYDAQMTFANTGARTAQQLIEDVLLDNGVPIGWGVDFQLEDWNVPAGSWVFQGSRMSAISAIAAAAGGYVQPHRTAQTLRILKRYPDAPWDWPTATPDVQIPADVAVREGITWADRPAYNRVYVSGQRNGRLVRVTRQGTAGDVAAPMVVDQLITDVVAGRQRGLSILAATGRGALVTLSAPVLPVAGIVEPGALLRYVDGGVVRLGMVRSLSVSAQMPQIRQTLGVETYVP